MSFENIFKRKEKVQEQELPKEESHEEIKKQEYNPKLGDANRYENARRFNRELADEINKSALSIVNNAIKLLEELEQNPGMSNFHSKTSGDKWNIHFIKEKVDELHDLYGNGQLQYMQKDTGIPFEVVSFEKRAEKLIYNH